MWHVTLANIWLGSAAPLTNLPFVYGPVGGGVTTPWRLLPSLGVAGAAFEVARTVVRAASRFLNPLCSLAMRRAAVILVQNEETLQWIPASWRSKAVVAPNAIVDAHLPERATRSERPPTALFAGELLPLKGVTLAIRAIARAPGWHLLICGEGRDENRLRATARRLGVEGRVRFLGQRPRNEVLRLMAEEADVFLFPSLHDEGLMVVAEALTVGLPVVCLDRGGPRGYGIGVRAGTVRETSRRLARAIMSAPAPSAIDRFSLDSATERFAALLRSRGLLETQPIDLADSPRDMTTVLTFHRVVDRLEQDHDLTWDSFRRLADSVSASITDLESPSSARAIAMTFDDGTEDHLRAAQELQRRALPAVFFIPAADIGIVRTPRRWPSARTRLDGSCGGIPRASITGRSLGSRSSDCGMRCASRALAWKRSARSPSSSSRRPAASVTTLWSPRCGPRPIGHVAPCAGGSIAIRANGGRSPAYP